MAASHPGVEYNFGRLKKIRIPCAPRADGIALPFYIQRLPLSPNCVFFCAGHHASHAAAACFPAPTAGRRSLVVTLDGVGEGISAAIWKSENAKLALLHSYGRYGSIGWFFSNVTEALGWRHGSDEWKVMGLAAYGTPQPKVLEGFHPQYENGKLIRKHDYPSFNTWDEHGDRHYHSSDTDAIARIATRMGRENLAAEAQRVVEEQVSRLIFPWLKREKTGSLFAAGGVFLNVKMNQMLWQSGNLSDFWIYPNPGDSGLAAGAALLAHTTLCPEISCEPLQQFSLGPEFSNKDIRTILKERGLLFREVSNPAEAALPYLLQNRVVAWFQGRAESGPRALGHRSILMDPRHANNKDLINAKIKFREAFRPFCPSILAPKKDEYLINTRDDRFMMSSFQVREEYRVKMPAVVHVDGSVRPQFVHRNEDPLYYELIKRFGDSTGIYALLNTSFNIKGEPIVCSPRDALRTFFDTGIDILIIGNFVIQKPGLEERTHP